MNKLYVFKNTKKILALLAGVFYVLVFGVTADAQCPPPSTAGTHTVTYTANCSFTVPAGVTSIQVECWGGGGGGGAARTLCNPCTQTAAGGGGKGGMYSITVVPVNAGESISIAIGSGGTAGNASNGGSGGKSSLSINSVEQAWASGGNGGGQSTGSNGAGATGYAAPGTGSGTIL